MNVPEDLRYTSDHEWVRIEGDTATVGVTDYAQDALNDVVFVQLPENGSDVAVNDSISEVESTKSVSEIYAPLSGAVSAINDILEDAPETINSDPYGDGWIFSIKISDPSQTDDLLSAEAYRELTEG